MSLSRYVGGARHFRGANPAPGTAIHYLKEEVSEEPKITVVGHRRAIKQITSKLRRVDREVYAAEIFCL